MQKLLLLITLLCLTILSYAQVKIGDNPNTINASSILELESTNKGLLITRIAIGNIATWTLTGTQTEGTLVYNTNASITGGNGTGFYYWNGTQWTKLSSGVINHNTLDQAYDEGGAGAGRTITADAGSVRILGTGGLIIGTGNTLSNTQSLVVGQSNQATGNLSSITGGMLNTASGDRSFIGGGFANTASGDISTVGGGGANKNLAHFSTIAGGNDNHTFGEKSAIPGGIGLVTTSFSEIVVGLNNDTTGGSTNSKTAYVATDRLFVIGNGTNNNLNRSNALEMLKNGNTLLNGQLTLSDGVNPFTLPNSDGTSGQVLTTDGSGTVTWQAGGAGGNHNTLDEAYDEGGAGVGRTIIADAGAVEVLGDGGLNVGTGNTLTGISSIVVGINNQAAGITSSVGGGSNNRALGNISVVSGGERNVVSGAFSSINGGLNNNISTDSSSANGINNTINQEASVIAGGSSNSINKTNVFDKYSTISGGYNHTVSGFAEVIGGGYHNTTNGGLSTVGGGVDNEATGGYSTIPGGRFNFARSYGEVAIGFYNTDYTPNSTTGFDAADRLFVVGNGTIPSARSNALVLFKDGRLQLNQAFTLPNVDGTAAQVLTTDGAGNVTWQAAAGGGGANTLDLAYNEGGAGAGRVIRANAGAVVIQDVGGLNVGSTNTMAGDRSMALGLNNTVEANNSLAIGDGANIFNNANNSLVVGNTGTQIDGADNALAVGRNARVTSGADNSIALGLNTTTSGGVSACFGLNSTVSGDVSVAFGQGSTTAGDNSATFGFSSSANANTSTAFGTRNTAHSFSEMVIGLNATNYVASSTNSFVGTDRLFTVGNGTSAGARSDALVILKNGNTALKGQLTLTDGVNPFTLPNTDGTSGQVLTTDGSGTVTWQAAGAGGANTLDQAYDQGGAGAGRTITADNGAVAVEGTGGLTVGANTLTGGQAFAVGTGNIVSGDNGIATGSNSSVTGADGVAMGTACIAGNISVAMGEDNRAGNHGSVAIGGHNMVIDNYSTAIGRQNSVPSNPNFAIGDGNTITDIGAGIQNTVALGSGNSISIDSSLLVGNENQNTRGIRAMAFGNGLTLNDYSETVVGSFNRPSGGKPNTWDPNDMLFVIGNGTSAGFRSNAVEVLKNGNMNINGNLNAISCTCPSDIRLKTNILPLASALTSITKLGGYSYYWKDQEKMGDRLQVGVIAQDVQKLYPNLVHTDATGQLSVNYLGLIPVMIEATKEQQTLITEQDKKIEALENKIEKLESLEDRIQQLEKLLLEKKD